ncbi:hypothetical protein J6590_080593 [Homalodisca vitripennis]|nr:hypothetical protein J6590_080593 [Homalodisca vitripennis]
MSANVVEDVGSVGSNNISDSWSWPGQRPTYSTVEHPSPLHITQLWSEGLIQEGEPELNSTFALNQHFPP